jgi:hypothetical protein
LGVVNMDTITGGTPERMFGQFLILARMKCAYAGTADWFAGTVTGGTASKMEWRVRMVSCLDTDYLTASYSVTNGKYYPRVAVYKMPFETAGTAPSQGIYQYHEMGVVNFPPAGRMADNVDWGSFRLFFFYDPPDMTDYSGTAYLWLDGVVFMPTEGLYSVTRPLDPSRPWMSLSNSADGTVIMTGNNGPSDRLSAMAGKSQGPTGPKASYGMGQPYYSGGVPVGSGIVVLAANSLVYSSGSVASMAGSVGIEYFERWQAFRGND